MLKLPPAWLPVFTVTTSIALAQAPPLAPAPRVGHAMATAGAAGVFLIGAGPGDDALWLYEGPAWRRLSEGGPLRRSMAAAAYDTRRQRLVVFGGTGHRNGSRYGDTWEWDGHAWDERDAIGPGARDHHSMAYDEARGQVVMYGGWDADRKFPGDTWTWDGTRWTRFDTTATGPGGLGHLAMAYDARRRSVVLFGGEAPDHPATDGVWEWNGREWTRIAVSGPTPGARTRHRLAYDAGRGVTVLFGGQTGTGRSAVSPDDTWTWDGAVWTRVVTPGPPARYVFAMAYDSRRERVVVFGGGDAKTYGNLGDTWEWDGARWTQSK